MEQKIWNFVAGNKIYTAHSRNQLKKKRKAMRSNPNFTREISNLIPITLNTESGEARMPLIYVANVKKSDKNART